MNLPYVTSVEKYRRACDRLHQATVWAAYSEMHTMCWKTMGSQMHEDDIWLKTTISIEEWINTQHLMWLDCLTNWQWLSGKLVTTCTCLYCRHYTHDLLPCIQENSSVVTLHAFDNNSFLIGPVYAHTAYNTSGTALIKGTLDPQVLWYHQKNSVHVLLMM